MKLTRLKILLGFIWVLLTGCQIKTYSQSFRGDLKSDTTKFYLSREGAIEAIRTAEQLRISKFELSRSKMLIDIYRNQRDSSVLSSFIFQKELLLFKQRNEAISIKFKSANTERWAWRGGFFITAVFVIIKASGQ